ncbi:MAG: DUF389 domain-containing protein [Acidimicrobiales bacterium]
MGILTDSTATVIGAMLVAPLMTPLMAVSLALVARWPGRLLSSAALVAAGIAVPIVSGMIAAAVVGRGVDPVINSQITSRVDPTLLDLAVALAAGAAGAYAISRRDVADSLPGAAVAIALVPPLAVVGITLQLAAWDDALGALLLFVTNGLAIVAMGAVTFVVTGVASPGGDGDSAVGHWVAGFAATGLLVLWGLVESTASQNTQGAQTAIARETVERWSDDFELDQLEIANDSLMLALTGPTEPDVGQLEDLVAQLEGVVEVDSIDVRFTLESQWLLEFDE